MVLVPHFMLNETQQSLHGGSCENESVFPPGLQLQAGRGCSGLITNTIRHLYSSSEFTLCLHPQPPLCSPICCSCSVSVHPKRIWKSLGEITPYVGASRGYRENQARALFRQTDKKKKKKEKPNCTKPQVWT